MRIAINCRSFLKKTPTGIGRYAYHLVNSLSEIDRSNEYWLYVQKGLLDFKRRIPKSPAKNFSIKLDLFKKGIHTVLKGADIYHAPSPDFIEISKAKIVVTIHDLIYKTFPQVHTPEACQMLDQQMQQIVQIADKIICCSQNTVDDLLKYFDVDAEKVRLIYQGVDKTKFFPFSADQKGGAKALLRSKGITDPFILFVGTLEPRKNLKNLIVAFGQLKRSQKFQGQLVVVGMKGWMMEDLGQMLKREGVENDCIFLGYVPDQELCALYNCAEVFVFPSFYEGFGFPILEALACGTASVVSNTSSCREVALDSALLVDPHDSLAMAQAILEIVEDKEKQNFLSQQGLKRAQTFSFRNTAEETLEVYQQLYNL